ncbi:MAG TPA: hypothetical protein VIL04_10515 [Solirubrobacterales bacterium]
MAKYLQPTAPIAEAAVLPGDPKRAMELATELFERPLMSNLQRGLWGYWGELDGGVGLTVQSTGIGGPSAVAVLHELAGHGVRRAIRVGTCLTLDQSLSLGDVVVVSEALAGDGASRALDAPPTVALDGALTAALAARTGARAARIVTTDVPHDASAAAAQNRGAGALAVDGCATPLAALASRLGISFACALVVAEDDSDGLPREELDRALLEVGQAAAAALAEAQPASESGSSSAPAAR